MVLALTAPGCVYSHVITPLDTDVDATRLGDKVGRSDLHSVLWLVAWGDAGTQAAAAEGGLTTINHMDVETLAVLFGLYYHRTTIVYGE